jgi:hypothetical protein
MHPSRRLILAAALVACSASPAFADGFFSPFIGYNFGGDSANCLSLRNCEEHRTNWGFSFGSTGDVVGFEEDFGYAKDFFGTTPGGDNAVLTLMSNLMIVIPAGPVRPYGIIGLGLVRPHAKLDLANLAEVDQNALGWDIGGGLNVFFGRTFGVRGDVRHIRTLQDITLGGVFSNAPLDFWRASAGVTLRF